MFFDRLLQRGRRWHASARMSISKKLNDIFKLNSMRTVMKGDEIVIKAIIKSSDAYSGATSEAIKPSSNRRLSGSVFGRANINEPTQ